MKVVYVGHYRDGTGYGEAAKNYILALIKNGVEVAAIPYRLNDKNITPPKEILAAEKKTLQGVDKIVLHTLPYWFEPHKDIETVGIFSTEMSGIPNEWVSNINKLSKCIVSSSQSEACCRASGVRIPISSIPYCFNTEKYNIGYGKTEFTETLKKDGKTIFYNISEFVNRKNLSALLRAYYTEFSAKDNVHLVLKSHLNGCDPVTLSELFQRKNQEIVKGLNITKDMPGVTFLPIYMDENELYSLHNSCDIYISSSYGESWDLPLFDAMGFGKVPIYPNHTGYLNYMNSSVGYPVNYYTLPCFGLIDSDPNLYNSNFNFYSVDINHLRQCMRMAYHRNNLRNEKRERGIEKVEDYSYDVIGPYLRKALE